MLTKKMPTPDRARIEALEREVAKLVFFVGRRVELGSDVVRMKWEAARDE